jgi:hypothetical protein
MLEMQTFAINLAVPGKKEVTVGTRVDEETKRILDRIVEKEDRTLGYVTRELMLRGLALYKQDGLLREANPDAIGLKRDLGELAPVGTRHVDVSENHERSNSKIRRSGKRSSK